MPTHAEEPSRAAGEQRAAQLQGRTRWAGNTHNPLEHPGNLRGIQERLAVTRTLEGVLRRGEAPREVVASAGDANPADLMKAHGDEIHRELRRGMAKATNRVAALRFRLLHHIRNRPAGKRALGAATQAHLRSAGIAPTVGAAAERTVGDRGGWAAGQVDAVLNLPDRPALTSPELWTAMALVTEFRGRSITHEAHAAAARETAVFRNRVAAIENSRDVNARKAMEYQATVSHFTRAAAQEHRPWYREAFQRVEQARVEAAANARAERLRGTRKVRADRRAAKKAAAERRSRAEGFAAAQHHLGTDYLDKAMPGPGISRKKTGKVPKNTKSLPTHPGYDIEMVRKFAQSRAQAQAQGRPAVEPGNRSAPSLRPKLPGHGP